MKTFDNPFKGLVNLFTGGPKTERTVIREPASPREEPEADRRASEEAARKQRAALAKKQGSASTLLTSPSNGAGAGQRKTLLGSGA